MFMGLLHNLIKIIIFAYQFKNRQNMETLKPTYKETTVNKVNQGTYFKLPPTDTAPVWVRDH